MSWPLDRLDRGSQATVGWRLTSVVPRYTVLLTVMAFGLAIVGVTLGRLIGPIVPDGLRFGVVIAEISPPDWTLVIPDSSHPFARSPTSRLWTGLPTEKV